MDCWREQSKSQLYAINREANVTLWTNWEENTIPTPRTENNKLYNLSETGLMGAQKVGKRKEGGVEPGFCSSQMDRQARQLNTTRLDADCRRVGWRTT